MNDSAADIRSVVVEREFPHPPEKLWRALTQPHLIEEWLMKNDFVPQVGHRFNLRGEWGGVLDCEVLTLEANRALSYTWNFAHDEPSPWITYSPLPPLFLLLFTGLYMFALPYVAGARRNQV